MRTRRRRAALLAVASVVALAGVAAFLGRGHGSRVTGPQALRSLPDGDDAESTPPPAETSPPSPTGPADDATRPEASRPKRRALEPLTAGAAESYRERARFPPSSQPIPDEQADPVAAEREVTPVYERGRKGEEPTLTVFPAQVSFESPEPAVVYARLTRGGEVVRAGDVRGTLLTPELQPLGELVYVDDGTNGDPVAGDGTWTAVVEPGRDAASRLSDSYLVRTRAELEDGDER